jgi:DNA-binding winged helix-turn-helix (wHTH) protein
MKPFFIFLAAVLIPAGLISAFVCRDPKDEHSEKQVELVMRNIGHQLLLRSNDSTSRVLPVKKINENTYQISFQNSVRFIPDTLINVVRRELERYHLPKDYMVNVKDCQQKETIYAYEINAAIGNLIPCKGRDQEAGRYLVEIEFIRTSQVDKSLFLLLLVPLSFAVFYLKGRFPKKEEKEPIVDEDFIKLGNCRFYPEKNMLNFENKIIPLSEKETKSLKIFAANLNQVIEREKLMKEIWEEEGIVVISRNVDVLVSKLRKKLSEDNSIKISNVHGIGYKIMIEEKAI